jgi:hypothetical protein
MQGSVADVCPPHLVEALCLCWVLRPQSLQDSTASLLIYLCKRRAQRRSMSVCRVPCRGITASSSSVCRTVLQRCSSTSAPQQQPQGTAVRVRISVPCTLSRASEIAAVPAAHISQGHTAGRPQRHMRQGCNLGYTVCMHHHGRCHHVRSHAPVLRQRQTLVHQMLRCQGCWTAKQLTDLPSRVLAREITGQSAPTAERRGGTVSSLCFAMAFTLPSCNCSVPCRTAQRVMARRFPRLHSDSSAVAHETCRCPT